MIKNLLLLCFIKSMISFDCNRPEDPCDTIEYGELSQTSISDSIMKNYAGRLSFTCDTLFCSFNIGIIPKSKGIYCVAANGGWIDVNFPGSLYCNGVSLREFTFTIQSFNRQLYEELIINFPIVLPTANRTTNFDIIDNDGAFAFKVE